jgi:hypothetical protein
MHEAFGERKRERERERRMGGKVHHPLFLTIQHLSVKFFLVKGGKKKSLQP